MKFKFYDILSHLVPGFIVYLIYLQITEQKFDKDLVIPVTAITFVLGYFVNSLASWLEDIYYWTWGGKPSNRLLEGKDIWKVRFYESTKVREGLLEEAGDQSMHNNGLFAIAMRYATPEVNSRVSDFNASYAFSRVILTTILIVAVFAFWAFYDSIETYLVAIPLIFVAWLRSKQRGYYFAREVLQTYLKQKSA